MDYLVLGLLLIALVTDISRRKIYNWLTFPGILLGIVFNFGLSGWPGAWFALKGAVLGGLLFFIPFTIGGLGAGDLKLLAMIGAFVGWPRIVWIGLWTAALGGVLSLLFMLVRRDQAGTVVKFIKDYFWALLHQMPLPKPEQKNQQARTIPYAAAIILGYLISLTLK